MGILDFLAEQFVDVIDWTERPGELALRYPVAEDEIVNGTQLTVREGQRAFLYNDGQVADVFGPGLHRLETANLPLLTALLNWDKGFAAPFKSDLVFFTTREQIGLKWGTAQPVTVRDREFGPLRVRAYGSYAFRIADITTFAAKLLGTLDRLTLAQVDPQLGSAIATALATDLGDDSSFVDLAADPQALSARLQAAVGPAFAAWGLACTGIVVESVSLPEAVQG
jgi:membrane protease subunit (stomatin/prohibitin family)